MSTVEGTISRRHFLVASVLGGGGLLLGFTMGARAQAQAAAPTPNAFIRIDSQGRVTLTLPYVEMGQGAYTSQAQIVAEELEIEPASLLLEPAPANEKLYASPLFLGQITGGSGSLRGAWMTMRSASAAARLMLINAAARRWQVRHSTCRAENGRVIHSASGRSLGYGELASDAAANPGARAAPRAFFRAIRAAEPANAIAMSRKNTAGMLILIQPNDIGESSGGSWDANPIPQPAYGSR